MWKFLSINLFVVIATISSDHGCPNRQFMIARI